MADFISDKDFVPDAPIAQRQGGDGFIPDSDFVSDEDKYGDTLGQVKAFGLGALRGVDPTGLSSQALVKSGLTTPEALKGYEDTNPVASGLGMATGLVGGLAVPFGTPVKGIAALGKAASSLVPSAAGKVLAQAGALGLGSAIEGAAYGLGQSVHEDALGDPDALGEKLIANIGTGAIVGGALGATFGAAKGAIQKKFPKFLSEVDKAAIDAGDWEAIAKASDLPEAEKAGFIDGLRKKKANAPEIEAAAQELGAPVLPGMVSDNKLVQKGQSALLEGTLTYDAIKAQQIATQGIEKAEIAAQSALGAEADITKASLGDTLRGMVTETVEAQSKPINAIYDELKASYKILPVNNDEVSIAAKAIRSVENSDISTSVLRIANGAADTLEKMKTVDDLKRLRSSIFGDLAPTASPNEKRAARIIGDIIGDLEESSVVSLAEKEAKNAADKTRLLNLLEHREAANAQYSVFKDKLQRMGEVLGRKRVHGAQDFLDFVEGMTPEKIADKLSGKNNSEFLNWFSKEMPEGMAAISQYQKGVIREAAMKDGKLNLRRMVSEVDKMPREYREKIFTPDELKKIGSIKTYIEAFPKNFNPSNTANASAFRAFFESPVGSAIANARDFGIQRFIDAAAAEGETTAKTFVDGLINIERTAAKTTKAIASGANGIFSTKDYGTPIKGYLAISTQERRDKHDKTHPAISELNANPEKLIEHLSANTEAISQFAPKTSQAVQGTMTKAIQFLNSKVPQGGPQKPLSPKYKPSDAELAKWHKYFSAVESPTDVLHSVASGTLVPETMEALAVVYPKLLSEMQLAVTDKMTDAVAKKKVIPYRTKLALSMFLGSDLVAGLDSTSMLANQNMMSTATQSKADQQASQMASVNGKSLGNMNKPNRLMTPMQQSAQREDA